MVGMKGRSGGHNRKPADEKLREGNVGHARKAVVIEDDREDDLLPVPQARTDDQEKAIFRLENPFRENSVGRVLWEKLHATCGGKDLNIFALEPLLEAAAEVWSEHREMREQIRDEGRIITDANGSRRKHPLIGPCSQSFNNLLKAMAALGISPDGAEILYDTDTRPVNNFAEIMRISEIKPGWNPDLENRMRAIEARKRREKDRLQ